MGSTLRGSISGVTLAIGFLYDAFLPKRSCSAATRFPIEVCDFLIEEFG